MSVLTLESFSTSNLLTALPLVSFLLLMVLQQIWPRRGSPGSRSTRRLHNLLLFSVNTLILRIAVPLTVLSAAVWAQQYHVGLFNYWDLEAWMAGIACVVVLDFAIYWQHVLTHKVDLLWRLHKVHHADLDMDVTTAIRFHPIELVLSLLYRSVLVVLLGAPVAAIIVFELLLFISPAFNHSNLALPIKLDRLLRLAVVTPDVHRAHHSIRVEEQNTNYGFFLIWWDRLFSSYTARPSDGHRQMKIGVRELRLERVDQMLTAPFK